MLFPKIQGQKHRLTLTDKIVLKIDELSIQNTEKKEEKQSLLKNSGIISGSKHQIRRLSSSSLKVGKSSRKSFLNKKLSSNQKENRQNSKLYRNYQNDFHLQNKPMLQLGRCIKSSHLSPEKLKRHESIIRIGQTKQRKKELSKSQSRSERKERQTNSTSSIQISEQTLKIAQNPFLIQYENQQNKINLVEGQMESQNQFSFLHRQNTNMTITKSWCPQRDSKSQRSSQIPKNFRRKVSIIQSFTLQSSLISIKIEPQSSLISEKKRLMIETLIEDQDFEWKYQKFKEYIQKYSEFEIKLKQNFEMLQLLTDNIELLKQRIIPCKEYTTLKEIIEIVKPTITQKQQKAIDIKMSMVEWKKKFFFNIKKIKDKITNSWQQRSQRLRFRLQDNQELSQKAFDVINDAQKKKAPILYEENIIEIKNYLQTILLNQKQMIDDTQIFETNNEGFVQKIDLLEEEWTHAFDIFNFTLENCAKKCITLSQTIEKFYGRCSTAAFLKKGIDVDKQKDQKLLQNDECSICGWNQIKLKKIIQQNSLAKDHIIALKYLVAH